MQNLKNVLDRFISALEEAGLLVNQEQLDNAERARDKVLHEIGVKEFSPADNPNLIRWEINGKDVTKMTEQQRDEERAAVRRSWAVSGEVRYE